MEGAATNWRTSATVVQRIDTGYVVVVRSVDTLSLRNALLLSKKNRATRDEAQIITYCNAKMGDRKYGIETFRQSADKNQRGPKGRRGTLKIEAKERLSCHSRTEGC